MIRRLIRVSLGGKSKPLVARYIANKLVARNIVPTTARNIALAVKELVDPAEIPF